MTEMWSVQACRVCLASGKTHKLFRIEPLQHCYTALVGFAEVTGPNYVCFECSACLQKFHKFREKSLNALGLLETLVASGNKINQDTVELIDREQCKLNSSLKVCKIICSDHITGRTETLPKTETIEIERDESIESFKSAENVKEECQDSFESKFLCISEINVKYENPLDISSEAPIMLENLHYSDENVEDIEDNITVGLKKESLPNKSQRKKNPRSQKKSGRKPLVSQKRRAEFFSKFVDVVLMTQEEALDVIRQRRETANYKSATHKCELCYKGFLEQATFENHIISHSPSQGRFQCDFCRVHFRSRNHIVKHIRARHRFKFCCRKCPNVCRDGSMAMKHEAWHNGKSYSCTHCDAKFNFYSSLKNHERRKHPTELSCRLCGRCFMGPQGLLVHNARSHRGHQSMDRSEDHTCVECDIKFACLEALKRHRVVSTKHNLMKTENGCADCGDVFPTRDAYLQHRRLAHPRTYVAARKTDADSKSKVVRKRPKRIRRSRAKRPARPAAASAGAEGLAAGMVQAGVLCDICGRGFSKIYKLIAHMRIHTGERPYVCSICPKACATRVLLRCHERTHTRERPYRCAKCDRAFSTASNLWRHVHTVHAEAEPIHCKICDKTFKNMACIRLHVKHVHLKKPYPVRKGRIRKNQNTEKCGE